MTAFQSFFSQTTRQCSALASDDMLDGSLFKHCLLHRLEQLTKARETTPGPTQRHSEIKFWNYGVFELQTLVHEWKDMTIRPC
jgi:hypothetical protein